MAALYITTLINGRVVRHTPLGGAPCEHAYCSHGGFSRSECVVCGDDVCEHCKAYETGSAYVCRQ